MSGSSSSNALEFNIELQIAARLLNLSDPMHVNCIARAWPATWAINV